MRWPPATTRGSRIATGAASCCVLPMRTRTRPTSCGCWTRSSWRHTRFPLGELTKPEVRQIATELGLPTAAKPESQEICFVPAGDYRALLAERRGYAGEPGPIVDADGTRGRHAHRLRPLHGRAAPRPGRGARRGRSTCGRCAPPRNTVVIGRRDEVAASRLRRRWRAASWPGSRRRSGSAHRSAFVTARPTCQPRSRWSATIGSRSRPPTPVWAPAPGQAAVLYDGDVCLGGGRIARAA